MSKDEQNNENNEEIVEEAEVKSEEDTSKKINSEEEEEDSSEEEDEGEELDYKSEYERLQGELAQKNERIAKQDKKIIKLKRKEDDEDQDDNSEDKADNADLNELVSQKVQEQMNSFVADTIDEELDKLSSNEDEKKLIKWYFDNRIVKSGWSKKDVIQYLGEAKALANAKKFLATSKMLAKKVKSDDTKGSPNFTGTPAKQSPKVTENDRKMADKFFKGDIKKWLKYKS